jgi:hypothetical protein
VIPDPLPPRLSDLTPAQVDAFNAAWPGCAALLPDAWTRRDARRVLAGQLDLSRHEPALRAFAAWVTRHEQKVSTPANGAAHAQDPAHGPGAG